MSIWRRNGLIIFTAILASAAPALALFDIQDPLVKRYNTESRVVIAGTIAAINAENHVLTVKPATVYKGTPPGEGESLQIQTYAPDSLRSEAKAGQPVVVFKGVKSAAIHVADHWYLAEALEKVNRYRITARLSPAYDETFPGTTAELIKALDEIKAGKSTLIDSFPKMDFPAPQKVATLPAQATAFAALELTPGGPVTFFVATPAGLHAFTWDNAKLDDQTQSLGLANLKPAAIAAAVVFNQPALLLDTQIHGFDGKTFTHTSDLILPKEKILSLAVGDLAADGKPAVAFLTDKNLFRTTLSNALSSPPTSPYTAPIPPEDDTRLTGAKLTDYLKLPNNTFTAASMACIDINHDGRPDLIIATPQGALTLLNRGFGCYLVNKDFAAPLLDPAKTGKPAMPLLASSFVLDENKKFALTILWALQDDGALYRYDFPQKAAAPLK